MGAFKQGSTNTKFQMSRIIKACELFDIRLLDIKYNDDDPDSDFTPWSPSTLSSNINGEIHAGKLGGTRGVSHSPKVEPLTTVRLLITGMTCSACVSTLTQALTSDPCVVRASISLPLSRATVIYNSKEASPQDLISLAEDVGYGAEILGEGSHSSATQNLRLVQREDELLHLKEAFNGAAKWATSIAVIDWTRTAAMGSGLDYLASPILLLFSSAIASYIQLSHARWIHRNAWAHCYSKGRFQLPSLSMDTLLSLSLLLSIALSFFNVGLYGLSASEMKTYFSSASFLTVVISGGRYLDVTLKKQGASGLARLFRLQTEMETGVVLVEGSLCKTDDAPSDGQRGSVLVSISFGTSIIITIKIENHVADSNTII